MIELNIEGIEDLRNKFARLVPETQAKVLKGLAQVSFDTAQAQVDNHTKTGALFDSLRLRSDGEGGWIIGHDQRRAPYAPFVHWGSPPHIIKPREKKALRWVTKRGAVSRNAKGRFVSGTQFAFAQWVHHPGYKGHAYLVEAADEAIKQFDAIVRRIELSP